MNLFKLTAVLMALMWTHATYAQEKTVDLNEVTVTATKVKFYLNGDTITYNADAFHLSEGSMLDELIRQLPGVELRGDKIYVNGRFVESLLLNGKDFFKDDNKVLLNNLPNYMVKKVAVYEKQGDDSEFLGYEAANDTRYVMDVKLKKKYAIGYSANAELGGGTADKYLARLFAMRFTDKSRMGAYFNANNLNDYGKPGENTSWSPSKVSEDVTARKTGGLDYSVDGKDKKFKIEGNVQFAHNSSDIRVDTHQTMFLSGGDVYNRIRNNEERKSLNFSTNHRFYFEWRNANLELLPEAKYNRYDNRSDYASEAFNRDSFAINSNMRQGIAQGHEWQTGLTIKSRIKFNHTQDNLTLYAHGSYKNSSSEKFEHNKIEYFSNHQPSSTDFKNRYFDSKPNHGYDIDAKATYTYVIKRGIMLNLTCSFNRNYSDTWSNLYLQAPLPPSGGSSLLATSPTGGQGGLHWTLDTSNSYRSRQSTNTSAFEPFLVWKKETAKSVWKGQLAMPLSLQSRRLTYKRNNVDTTFSKRNVLLNMYSTYVKWASKDGRYNYNLQYSLTSKAPDMNMYLNISDTTDPLNITMGNADLKTSLSHVIRTAFIRMYPQSQIMWAVEGELRQNQNAIAMGYTYDKATGIRTYRPDNVNGCWSSSLNTGMSLPLDKRKKLVMELMAGTGYVRNVDLISTTDSESSSRSVVGTHSLTENFRLSYTIGKSKIGIISDCTWMRSRGKRRDFTPINAVEMKNGLTAKITLPWQFSLGTDLTLYSRSGYAYSDMNTTDFVWNAQLTRSLLKGKLLIQLDGYDLLKQLSNISRVLNAQGIVEKRTNLISQYVMLHATYHFSKKP